jgi:hypothetical protein
MKSCISMAIKIMDLGKGKVHGDYSVQTYIPYRKYS